MKNRSGIFLGVLALMSVHISKFLLFSDIETTDGSKISEAAANGLATLFGVPIVALGIILAAIGFCVSIVKLIKCGKQIVGMPTIGSIAGMVVSGYALYVGVNILTVL